MAIPPVTIEFLARGVPNVAASIRNVSTTLARAEQQASRDAERGARARERAATQEAKAKIAAYKLADREQAKAIDQATRAAERAANAGVRAAQRAEREKVREVERAEKQKQAIRERSATMAGQYAVRAAKADASASRATGRDRGTLANAMIGAGAQGVANGARRIGGIAMQTAGIAAQLGGGFSIADSVMGQSNLRGQAAALSAKTQLAGAGKSVSTDDIYSQAKAIGARQGIDPAEVMKGFDEVQKLTGDMKQAMRVMPGIARLATATGGNVGEMSGLAANILAANPNIADDKLESQMRIFTKQGVVGGVEVADFAKYGSRLTAGASMYGGDKEKNEATLGAMAQMARQYGGAATAAEATLGAQRFSTDIAKHASSLKKGGIDVSDGQGNLKDAQTVLMEMLEKSGGDVTKLAAFGLGERGVKPLQGVANIFKNAGGGAKGRAAVEAEFAKYTSGVSEKEVQAAESTVLNAPDKKIFAVMEQLRLSVGEALLPEFLKLAPVIAESTPAFVMLLRTGIPAFVELIKSISDFANANKGIISDIAAHPIGSIMAFEVTKSIVEAGLGNVVKNLVTQAFQGGGAGGAGAPGGAAGGAAGAGAGMAVVAGGIAQVGAISGVYVGARNAMAEGQAGGTAAGNALVNGTAAERAKAEADIATAKGASGDGATAAAWTERLTKGVSYLAAPSMGLGALATAGVESALGSYAPGAQSEKAIKASEFVDAAELSRITTQAIANGVREGVAQGSSSGPNGAGRSEPIIAR